MEAPKVSVIVPVYNTEKYLEKCLNSLLNQTWTNMEIIVIDDGSTDSSGVIAKKLQEQHPETLRYVFQENSGQGKARNLGIEMCTGDYIGFLDSDDYAEYWMFEDMVMCSIANDADYVACGYTEFYEEDGKEITIKPYVASKKCRSAEDLYHDIWVSPWLHLYKAEVIRNSGVKFPEKVIYEDIAFFINLIPYLNKVACIESGYVHHRKHKSSTTMGSISLVRFRNIFPVIDSVREWYDSHDWNDNFIKLSEYVCVRLLLCSSVDRIRQLKTFSERQTAIRETLDYIRRYYKNYRKNPEMKHGLRGLYMRSANHVVVTMLCEMLRLKNRRIKYS